MTDMNVRLSQRVALDFSLVKNAVSNKWGKQASNFDVVVELIQAYKDRKNLITQKKSLERKLAEKDEEIIAIMREFVNKPQAPININVGALAQATSQPQQWLPPKPVHKIDEGKQNKLKDELLEEFKKVCIVENSENGQLLPSKMSNVEFDDVVLLEVETDE